MIGYYPEELNIRVSGRAVWQNGALFLSHSAAYAEFFFEGDCLEADIASEGGGEDFQAWVGVFVNDAEVKRFALQAGENRYRLWESDRKQNVKIRLVKLSENQYAYVSIRKFFMDSDAKITRTEGKEKRIQFIGDSITCGFGNEGNAGDGFKTGTENPLKAYAYLTAQKLSAEATLIAWSGIGIISSYVDPDVEVPNTGVLVPVVYPHTDYSLQCRMGWETQEFDFASDDCNLIVINLGTNDSSYTRNHEDRKNAFCEAYQAFVTYLCKQYKNVPVICTAGAMNSLLNQEIATAAQKVRAEGYPVYYMEFTPAEPEDGEGAVGHPSLVRHEKMAGQLAGWITEHHLL
ncbi:MAG: hypothetical protein E7260_02145 [Lachnospiraceae bacterium]|nr:hypothetical protein [Lachnospiraceae bacterium]